MEINRILAQLHTERDRVQRAITTLEWLLPESSRKAPQCSTRGRKSMSAEERKEVGERIKAYCAKKRQQDAKQ
jgi:hypothetical protein